MEHIVFHDGGSLKAEIRKPKFAHTWTNFPTTSPDQVAERLSSATIAITSKMRVRAEALAKAKQLRLIAVAATGTDIVDLAACRSRNILVQNVRNYANASLPEHVFALILALRRNLFAYRADVESDRWQRAEHFCLLDHPIRDLAGSTLGVVGFGALGKAVAALGVAFGMRVLAFDVQPVRGPGVEVASLDQILATSDVISLHVPLSPGTASSRDAAQLFAGQHRPRRPGRRAGACRCLAGGPHRRCRIRRALGRAAACRKSAARVAPTQFRAHPAHRLGERASDAGPGRPVDRRSGKFHRGYAAKRRRLRKREAQARMPAPKLTATSSLPADGFAGALAGRVWRPDRDGPSVGAIRADGVVDGPRAVPTMSDLCET